MRLAVRGRDEGQVLAEHVGVLTDAPCVVVARRRDGWRIDGVSGVELGRVGTPPPSEDGALDAWLTDQTGLRLRGRDLLHGRRRVARLFLAAPLSPAVVAACRAVEPYFAALDLPRDRAPPCGLELSALAHDLRQPLSSLRMWLTLLHEGRVCDGIDRCRATVARMDALIEDVLLLDPAQRRCEEDLDLAALVEELLAESAPVAARRGVQLRIEVRLRPHVPGHRMSLWRALANVVQNAIAHGPPDHEVVATVGAADGRAFVEVRDEGGGIPVPLREQVFAARFTTAPGGSGLGLAVTRAVADAHGGRAFVVDGAVSRMRIELPLGRAEPQRAMLPPLAAAAASERVQ